MLGTVSYMAPEQARGDRMLDARADVFALGCVLFECLAASPAFDAAHPTAILTKILFEETPRLSERFAAVPEPLETLLLQWLSKDPAERPRDGSAAAAALQQLRAMPVALLDSSANHERPRRRVLTASENQAVAVILVPSSVQGVELGPDIDGKLVYEAVTHGGILERLVNGSRAVLLTAKYVATDLAVQAARCALAMAAHVPDRGLILAMGRSEVTGRRVIGPAIERAAGLLGSASISKQPGCVMVDDLTAGLLDGRFDVRDEDDLFVLHGEREVGEIRKLLGKPTACVGRERELGTLNRLLASVIEEEMAQAVLITAPPGMGKSRLALEFLHNIHERGVPVAIWRARGDSLHAGAVFGLLGQLLRAACGIRESEPLEVRRQKIREQIAQWLPESERKRVAEFVGEIMGTPFPDKESFPLRAARMDVMLMNEQTRRAFLDFMHAACAQHPVVIVLDDLQWSDRTTVQFIERALGDLSGKSLFLLALARPEVHEVFPRLWPKGSLQEIRLPGLNRRAIELLARQTLGKELTRETIERIARLSEGNAFYLEELIRWTAEGQKGDWPETVMAMVQSRLWALEDDARRVLRAASVFGESSWPGAVGALIGGTNEAQFAQRWMRELVECEVLVKRRESRFPGEDEITFRHALLRDGAYGMLTEQDRTLGHKLAGEWLAAKGETNSIVLADHFDKGGERERAGGLYLRAFEQARDAGDWAVAADCAQKGLGCSESHELRLDALGALCEALVWQPEAWDTAREYGNELVQIATRGSKPWVYGMLVHLDQAAMAGDATAIASISRELLNVEPAIEVIPPLTFTLGIGAMFLDHMGKIEDANRAVHLMTTLSHRVAEHPTVVQSHLHLLLALRCGYVGDDPVAGLRNSYAAAKVADDIGSSLAQKIALVYVGLNAWFLGQLTDVANSFQKSTIADIDLGLGMSLRPFVMAWMLADQGAFAEASTWASPLVQQGRLCGMAITEGRGHWALAEILRRNNELDRAESEINEAVRLLSTHCPLDSPGVLATLAALRLQQGRFAEALLSAEDAMAKYAAMDACSFFRGSFLHLVHAECLDANGRRDDARAAITRAKERLFRIVSTIDDPAQRESFLFAVPENQKTIELAQSWLT